YKYDVTNTVSNDLDDVRNPVTNDWLQKTEFPLKTMIFKSLYVRVFRNELERSKRIINNASTRACSSFHDESNFLMRFPAVKEVT
ncbi:hypothetical protein L9F63_012313, partial [Diploptera punctata]